MSEDLLIIEFLPSIVCFSCVLSMNLYAFSLDVGAVSCKVDIKIFNRINKLYLFDLPAVDHFLYSCSHLFASPLEPKSCFVLCLGFCWDLLSLIHFPKQATTGWPEARAGTNLRGNGALPSKAAGTKEPQNSRKEANGAV